MLIFLGTFDPGKAVRKLCKYLQKLRLQCLHNSQCFSIQVRDRVFSATPGKSRLSKTYPEPLWANIWVRNPGKRGEGVGEGGEEEGKKKGRRRKRNRGGGEGGRKREERVGRRRRKGEGKRKIILYGRENHQGFCYYPHVSGEKTGTHSVQGQTTDT